VDVSRGIRGRIDPQVRARLDQLVELVGPDGLAGIEDIEQRRRRHAELTALVGRSPMPESVVVSDHRVDGLLLRTYRPHGSSGSAPCIYHLHGGGLVSGSVTGDDAKAAALASETDAVVVAVDYRLAPENRYPAALDDCVRGLEWLAAEADALGINRDRVAVHGSSAGGGLAAATALRVRDEDGPALALLMLVSPMLDDRTSSPSTHANTGFGAWSREANVQAWRAYLGPDLDADRVPAYAAPARAQDLSELPPTFVDTGDLDLFRDEAVEFASRLMWSGVPVELHIHPGAIHGGESLAPAASLSVRARTLRVAALRRALVP
jgi:acetyl esterase/lipase